MVVVIVGKTIDEEIDITVADREIFCKNLRDAIDRSKKNTKMRTDARLPDLYKTMVAATSQSKRRE
jgi:hypothetical protein